MADIFISYKREDRDQVQTLAYALQKEGFTVWWDPELPLGQTYASSIHAELNKAKVVMPVWTGRSVESEWVQEEATQGKKLGLLIPVRLEAVDPPIGFTMVQTADLAGWRPDAGNAEWDRLVTHLRAKIQGGAPHPARVAPPPRPAPAAPAKAKSGGAGAFVAPAALVVALLAAGGAYFAWIKPGAAPSANASASASASATINLPFGLGGGGNGAGGAPPAPRDSGQAPAANGANATILDPRVMKLGVADAGEIYTNQDTRFYRFDNELKIRDLVNLRLENLSTTLKPDVKLFDENKSALTEKYDGNPGASLDYQFTVEAGKSVYLQVLPYGSTGKYKLSITPQRAYDQFEPNDDKLTTPGIRLGQTVSANIMDGKDEDWYKISGVNKPAITVTFENQSTTLKPDIKLYDSNKSGLVEKYDGTPGANLNFEQTLKGPGDIYVQVLPYGSTGKYTLKVE